LEFDMRAFVIARGAALFVAVVAAYLLGPEHPQKICFEDVLTQ